MATALCETDPAFAEAVEEALGLYTDHLEEKLVASGETKTNPVGLIVRLKALRPDQYIEKSVALNLTAETHISAGAGLALIQQLLGKATNATLALIPRAPEAMPLDASCGPALAAGDPPSDPEEPLAV